MNIQTVIIQITNRCPYHCPQCYMDKGNEDLPIKTATQYIDQLMICGIQGLQLTGGEPICYPRLCNLIEHAHNMGIYVFLATSGYRHSIEYYRELRSCGLDILCVSLNDIDESINRLTRDTYEESLEAIREAIEVGLICCVNVVVSDQNIQNFSLLPYKQLEGLH